MARYLGRNSDQCQQRWQKSLAPAVKRGRWSKAEDECLRQAVEAALANGNPTLPWKVVASRVRGRTDVQCRERWSNRLDPRISKVKIRWDREKDAELLKLYDEHGPRWVEISERMSGSTTRHEVRCPIHAFVSAEMTSALQCLIRYQDLQKKANRQHTSHDSAARKKSSTIKQRSQSKQPVLTTSSADGSSTVAMKETSPRLPAKRRRNAADSVCFPSRGSISCSYPNAPGYGRKRNDE